MTDDILIKKVKKTLDDHSMLDGDSVLAGFSGGIDSTVMLHALDRICRERGVALRALHVNHMIRGEEALRDEQFCRDFCMERGIPFDSVRIDVPALAKAEKTGLEECARKYRYMAFEEYRVKYSVSKIATAHNANDNLETILFNLSRGCSLSGVCGIAPVRGKIVRPLIEVSREEITAYAEENRLSCVYDSTNSDTDYSRNHIRHNIVPGLMKLNPSLIDTVSRFSRSAREDSEYLKSVADRYEETYDVSTLASLPPPILKRVLSARFEKLTGSVPEAVHLEAMTELVSKGKDRSFVSLPHRMTAGISGGKLIIGELPVSFAKPFCRTVRQGSNEIPEARASLYITESADDARRFADELQIINKKFILKRIKMNDICGSLFVRSRENGDRYVYGNMTRSVKKLLNSAKLSAGEKETLPFLCDEKGIIWIPGFPVRDSAKTDSRDQILNIIYFSEIKDV